MQRACQCVVVEKLGMPNKLVVRISVFWCLSGIFRYFWPLNAKWVTEAR